jgi:hypothetical protein
MKPQTLKDILLLLKANRQAQLWGPGLIQEILNDARNVDDGDDEIEDEDEDSNYDY